MPADPAALLDPLPFAAKGSGLQGSTDSVTSVMGACCPVAAVAGKKAPPPSTRMRGLEAGTAQRLHVLQRPRPPVLLLSLLLVMGCCRAMMRTTMGLLLAGTCCGWCWLNCWPGPAWVVTTACDANAPPDVTNSSSRMCSNHQVTDMEILSGNVAPSRSHNEASFAEDDFDSTGSI